MTAAFNLSQLANNLNTSGQLDASDGLYGVLPVANGGTGSATGAFSGANITSLNASNISSGTLATDRLPAGSVVQVKSFNLTTFQTSTANSWVDTNLQISITPTSSSSKILVHVDANIDNNGSNAYAGFLLLRNTTVLTQGQDGTLYNSTTWSWSAATTAGGFMQSMTFLDSPNTTSSTTYKLQFNALNGGRVSLNRTGNNDNYGGTSSITVMEIKA